MRLDYAYALTSRLVALSGLVALLLTREAADWLVLPASALALYGILRPGSTRYMLPERAVGPLAGLAGAFAVFDFFFIGGSLIVAGADFLVLLLMLKLASLNDGKDHMQMYTLSFFLLLASSGLSTELSFLAAFLVFFVSLTWALMLGTMKGAADGSTGAFQRWKVGRSFFVGAAGLTLAAFMVTLVIFFSLPRVGIGYFSRRAGGLLKTVGFSDTVELGSMGEVKQDPTVVMRVELVGVKAAPERQPYWRGRAFDFYDGKAWKDTLQGRLDLYRTVTGSFFPVPGKFPSKDALVQNISLEPLDTTTIFALYPAYMITADFRSIWVDENAGLHLQYPTGNRVHYAAYSAPRAPTGAQLESQEDWSPGQNAQVYLQLPEGSDRLRGLALQVTAGAATPYEKANKIKDYLAARYSYTLNPARDGSLSPMDDFLFGSKEGYCEHFATAMTLMLRAADVPARLVSGFMGGTWNDYGGYYLVREQDAHTWVEVFFPKYGWVVFDPTPSVEAAPRGFIASSLGGALDYMKFKWDRYIVFYNLRDQVTAVGRLADAYRALKGRLGSVTDLIYKDFSQAGVLSGGMPARPSLTVIAIAISTLAALLLLWRVIGGRTRGRRASRVAFYAKMEGILRRKGLVRPLGATPREFAGSLSADMGVNIKEVIWLTDLYNRMRFGGGSLSREEQRRVSEALERLNAVAKSSQK